MLRFNTASSKLTARSRAGNLAMLSMHAERSEERRGFLKAPTAARPRRARGRDHRRGHPRSVSTVQARPPRKRADRMTAPPSRGSAPGPRRGLAAWFDDRTGYRAALRSVLDRSIPGGARAWYV